MGGNQNLHVPVMLAEVVEYLAIRPGGIYLDATCGMGGHTSAIARRLSEMPPTEEGAGQVIACDRDGESLRMAAEHIQAADPAIAQRVRFHQCPFSQLAEALAEEGLTRVDGLLADLGVSRYQLTEPTRGFSLQADGPLDMRLDQSRGQTAAELVNHSAEKALADWIFQFGEERRARKIARAIVQARPIRSTLHLADVVERAVPRTSHIHPATRTFMALRIAVNEEQVELDRLLQAAPGLVAPGGRICILSFMSLEDRKPKVAFREWQKQGLGRIVTKKPLEPGKEEVVRNPPSRSAKLRVFEISGREMSSSEMSGNEISGSESSSGTRAEEQG